MGAAREDDLAGVIDSAAFERDGALRFERQLTAADLETLKSLADERAAERPGRRIAGDPRLTELLSPSGRVGRIAAGLTSYRARPVRAIIFDKTANANWSVAWHQDRTIPVKERLDVEGFGPWSIKDGLLHVAPPFEVLARMATLRVHLDAVESDNAPLRIAVGSHRLGRVAAGDAGTRAAGAPQQVCLAEAGDIWAYRTPILHASDRAVTTGRRRVLQVDYADFNLPEGLKWRGMEAT
ncbi:MAG: phytanoyl-CoA dioxygenase family protein [Caulobacterales bacterium]|nr:phytanoyl-CoA dioxygenase family protein [Caulobacterales bacterium]